MTRQATISAWQRLALVAVLVSLLSGLEFSKEILSSRGSKLTSGKGAINFIFALPAIRTIDTLGRRKWLIITLPLMALSMGAAAASFSIPDVDFRIGVVVMWLFCRFWPIHGAHPLGRIL